MTIYIQLAGYELWGKEVDHKIFGELISTSWLGDILQKLAHFLEASEFIKKRNLHKNAIIQNKFPLH